MINIDQELGFKDHAQLCHAIMILTSILYISQFPIKYHTITTLKHIPYNYTTLYTHPNAHPPGLVKSVITLRASLFSTQTS